MSNALEKDKYLQPILKETVSYSGYRYSLYRDPARTCYDFNSLSITRYTPNTGELILVHIDEADFAYAIKHLMEKKLGRII